jgi:hypothetical protein
MDIDVAHPVHALVGHLKSVFRIDRENERDLRTRRNGRQIIVGVTFPNPECFGNVYTLSLSQSRSRVRRAKADAVPSRKEPMTPMPARVEMLSSGEPRGREKSFSLTDCESTRTTARQGAEDALHAASPSPNIAAAVDGADKMIAAYNCFHIPDQ